MTLRELLKEQTLSEEAYVDRNYWATKEPEHSVVSGKEILGFPSTSEHIPLHLKSGLMYDIVKIGDNLYEFYIGDFRKENNAPYKNKDCYIGTYKFDAYKDGVGVALGLIQQCINNKKLSAKEREFLRDFYNKNRTHAYYKKYFEEL